MSEESEPGSEGRTDISPSRYVQRWLKSSGSRFAVLVGSPEPGVFVYKYHLHERLHVSLLRFLDSLCLAAEPERREVSD